MDCPFLEIDRDIIQCAYTGKVFGNIVNGKERHGRRGWRLLSDGGWLKK
jgi:hypothetical protein